MKCVKNATASDKRLLINEASLISHLQSDELIKCVDLYDWCKSIYMIVELMDRDMAPICLTGQQNYSEDFCRYTLYKVAKGLQAMHNKNVLHRDIKSDNVLYTLDG